MTTPEGMHPEVYQKLLNDYEASLPEKLRMIEISVQALKLHFNKEDLTTLRFIVHKIAGNAAIFGFQALSDLCRPWDIKLSQILATYIESPPSAAFFSELEEFIQQCKKAAQKKQ